MPDTAAGTGTQAVLWTAKGEVESFQIVVQAPKTPLTNVKVAVGNLYGPNRQVISAATAVTVYREHYVYVSKSSPDLGGMNRPKGPGYYPDALIPVVNSSTAVLKAFPFSLAAGKNQPVWVDIATPAGATAGQYVGSYTVTSDQGTVTGSVVLNVWNFALPAQPSLKSSFSFGNGDSGSAAANQEMLKHRLSPILVPESTERTLIDSLGLSSRNLNFWSDANAASCTMNAPPDPSVIKQKIAAQQPDLFLYNYTADEIGNCPASTIATLKSWAVALHTAGAKNLVTMTPRPELYDDGTGRPVVDVWVLLPFQQTQAPGSVADVLAKGGEVWSYNALAQDSYSPKWEIDFDSVDFRIQPGLLNQSMGLTGVLYWKVDRWSADPWNDVNNTGKFAENANYPGEGMLVYPGTQAGLPNGSVAPSMRLKWLRDGSDDFEYVQLLKQRGWGDWALQVARRVAPDWANWSHDPAQIEAVRQVLGTQLDKLASSPAGSVQPAAVTSSWQTAFVIPPDNSFADDVSRNFRVVVKAGASAASGSNIRITVKASSKAGVIGDCYIGEMSSNGAFNRTPTKITWNKGQPGATVPANTTLTSDAIKFAFDRTKRYGIHFYCPRRNFVAQSPAGSGWGMYRSYRDGPSTGTVLNPASTAYSIVFAITSLEVF